MKKFFLLIVGMLSLSNLILGEESQTDSVKYVLPEQTITGTRREFRWLENPSAITTLSAKDQPINRGLGLSDNLLLIPGMSSTTRFGTDDIRLAMRGLGARSNSGIRGVRVLYDGIPESEPDGQTRLEGIEVGNLDRVEVLRGSGSSLYGNAAGGVVNLRTASSFPRTGVRADVVAGGFGFSKYKVSCGSGPTFTDTALTASLDLRDMSFDLGAGKSGESGTITASQVKSDGWRDHSNYEGQIVSGSWTAKSTPKTEMRTVFYFTNVKADLPGPLTKKDYDANEIQAASKFLQFNAGRITRKGRLGFLYKNQLSPEWKLNFTPYAALKKMDRSRENGQYQTITRYILGGTAQTEWAKRISDHYETEMICGFDQQLQDGPVSFYNNQNGQKGDTLLSQNQEWQWGQGYFLQWELENLNVWGLMLGARYDHVRLSDESLNSSTPKVLYDREAITPRAAFRYHLKQDIIAFASLCGGFETPTLAETQNTMKYLVKPQKTTTVELGVRGEQKIAKHYDARWEITAYHMAVTDAVVPDQDPVTETNYYSNAGKARHQGVEISAKLARARWGFFGVAASFGSFVFTDYKTPLGDYTDKKIPGVSPNMYSAVARWTPADFFFAELTLRSNGEIFADNANTTKADGWLILGSAVGGRIPVQFMTASWQVGIQNITDKKYVSFVQSNDSKGRYFECGMPQAITAGISIGTPGL